MHYPILRRKMLLAVCVCECDSQKEMEKEVLRRFASIRFAALVMDCVLAPLIHPLLGVPVSQAELGDGRHSFLE